MEQSGKLYYLLFLNNYKLFIYILYIVVIKNQELLWDHVIKCAIIDVMHFQCEKAITDKIFHHRSGYSRMEEKYKCNQLFLIPV